jgi:hypothetical protein
LGFIFEKYRMTIVSVATYHAGNILICEWIAGGDSGGFGFYGDTGSSLPAWPRDNSEQSLTNTTARIILITRLSVAHTAAHIIESQSKVRVIILVFKDIPRPST